MQLDAPTARVSAWLRPESLAAVVWVLLLVVICSRAFVFPRTQTVYTLFSHAARNWRAGEDIYDRRHNPDDVYRYSPAGTVLLLPFSFFPDNSGGVLWRLVNFAVYLGAFAWWCRAVLPGGPSFSAAQHALMWLLIVPLSVGSLNNGQANPLVLGLVLAAVAGARAARWNLAAMCVTLACMLKIYPLAVGLLLVAVYPRQFGPRLLAALALGFALPFLCQHHDYVLQEYGSWLRMLDVNERKFRPLDYGYRDLWQFLQLAQVSISSRAYLVVQLALAGAVAGLCLAGKYARCSHRHLLTVVTTQASCWMILCGPATEWSTYMLLAPTLAWAVVEAWQAQRFVGARLLLAGICGMFLLPALARMFPNGRNLWLGLVPSAALVLWVYLLAIQVRGLFRPGRENSAGPALAA